MHEKMFPHNWNSLDAFKPLFKTFSSSLTCSDTFGQLSLKSFPRDNYHRTTSPPEILHMTIDPWILLPDIFALLIPPWTTISRQLTPNEIPCGTSSHEHLPWTITPE